MTDLCLLSLVFVAPLAGALLLLLIPERFERIIRALALGFSAIPMAVGIGLFWQAASVHRGGFLLRDSISLSPSLGLSFHLGADGLSATLLFLSGVISMVAILASFGITKQVRGYFSLLLVLFAGMNGVFVALDMVLFYVFWELMLIPMFFLIAIWGGEQRRYASMKFFFYTMAGSIMLLVVMLTLHIKTPIDGLTVSLSRTAVLSEMSVDREGNARVQDLAVTVLDSSGDISRASASAIVQGKGQVFQVHVPRDFNLLHWRLLWKHWTTQSFLGMNLAVFAFLFFFLAFAVKVPVFPLHTWLPHAHVQAPTAVSVVLAGVLLKLGVYGFLRIAWPLFPTVAAAFGGWIGVLGVIAIVWAALAALGQKDLKRLVAYSSVSHMGFCLLGLAALTVSGITGSMFQMFSHGIGAALLFLLVGVLYDRAHHRRVDGFGGLAATMPAFTAVLMLAAFSSIGLPSMSGFVGELTVILGSFQSRAGVFAGWSPDTFRWLGLVAATGVILSAAYLLWTVQRVAFGPLRHPEQGQYPDLTLREKFSLYPLVALTLLFGIWPQPLLSALGPWAQGLSQHVASALGAL
ncbi:MAG: hypothetical protein RL318_791 [Fibrobacterota bacterium]|jgi:NADH-quinone oxidoreductase subunit M